MLGAASGRWPCPAVCAWAVRLGCEHRSRCLCPCHSERPAGSADGNACTAPVLHTKNDNLGLTSLDFHRQCGIVGFLLQFPRKSGTWRIRASDSLFSLAQHHLQANRGGAPDGRAACRRVSRARTAVGGRGITHFPDPVTDLLRKERASEASQQRETRPHLCPDSGFLQPAWPKHGDARLQLRDGGRPGRSCCSWHMRRPRWARLLARGCLTPAWSGSG